MCWFIFVCFGFIWCWCVGVALVASLIWFDLCMVLISSEFVY